MRDLAWKCLVCLLVVFSSPPLRSQESGQSIRESTSSIDGGTGELEQKLQTISTALAATERQLEQSHRQIQQLQEELDQVRKQLDISKSAITASSSVSDSTVAKGAGDLQERVETLEAQVKLHDQTKVESSSKYPLRLTGLILFNSFINRGSVDNFDLPSIAVPRVAGLSNGGAGASMRQTILGVEAFGPIIAGARTSANVSLDFFGGIPLSNFGTSSGIVRMRTASINFDWNRNLVQVGVAAPLISPLSPTSYATVAEPGMAWAGNLWTWAPQLRVAHQFVSSSDRRFQLEFGLWDPPAAGYNTTDGFRTPSPGEQTNQPAYEGRVSYGSTTEEHALQIGVGGYYSRQQYSHVTIGEHSYSGTNDSWAFTTDLRIPLSHRFELSGEGYRGRSLGGLGGGAYKDVLYGFDPISGAPVIRGVNDIGGWTQFKTRFGQLLEANASVGLDNGFANDFHSLILPYDTTATQLRARNRMIVGNVIYRPKTYLIFSPEYRRIWTWPIYGVRSTADLFTFSVGYQF
jgi:chaperonin cofactor prefoldin